MLVKQILTTKNAVHYYKSLDDEKTVNKYSEKFKEIKSNIKINKRKVVDHDHLTGQFRRTAHSICNLTYKILDSYPSIFTVWLGMMLIYLLSNSVKMMEI